MTKKTLTVLPIRCDDIKVVEITDKIQLRNIKQYGETGPTRAEFSEDGGKTWRLGMTWISLTT